MVSTVALIVIPLVVVVVLLLTVFILSKSIYVVQQAEAIVIERFGRFNRVLGSGLHFTVPFIDTPRTFSWRRTHIDVSGNVVNDSTHGFRIDMRESVFNFPSQDAYTKETVRLQINALMFFRISNVFKAIYEVDDLQGALANTAQSQIKEIIGRLTFTQCLEAQDQMNQHLAAEFSKIFSQWGIVVERMELLELEAKSSIADAMKKQMVAERDRRGDFIRSEGKKAALRLRAEGEKIVSVNIGLAEQEAKRKQSEGTATAKIQLARAESLALDTVAAAILVNPTSYMVAQKYISVLSNVITRPNTSTIYLPYVARGLTGSVASLPSLYGADAAPAPIAPRVPAPDRASADRKGKESVLDDDDDGLAAGLLVARPHPPPLPSPTPASPAASSAAGVGGYDDFSDLN